jgi:hypothetical protein
MIKGADQQPGGLEQNGIVIIEKKACRT